MFFQHREWNWGTDVCRKWFVTSSPSLSPWTFSSIKSSLQFLTGPTNHCCCQSTQCSMNWDPLVFGQGGTAEVRERERERGGMKLWLLSDCLKFQFLVFFFFYPTFLELVSLKWMCVFGVDVWIDQMCAQLKIQCFADSQVISVGRVSRRGIF